VVRRHPDIKWLRRKTDAAGFGRTQAELLEALWRVLAPDVNCCTPRARCFPRERRSGGIFSAHPKLKCFLPRARPEECEPPLWRARSCRAPIATVSLRLAEKPLPSRNENKLASIHCRARGNFGVDVGPAIQEQRARRDALFPERRFSP
jgi:hypothetical protein